LQHDLRIDEGFFSLGLAYHSRLQPLLRLLLISNADRALLYALAQIPHQIAVEGHIILGGSDNTLLQQDVEILPGNQQCDVF